MTGISLFSLVFILFLFVSFLRKRNERLFELNELRCTFAVLRPVLIDYVLVFLPFVLDEGKFI